MVKIKRISLISKVEHTLEIPISEEQYNEGMRLMEHGGYHVQNAFPMLNADYREFILSGITPEEWTAAFPPEEEDDDLEVGMTDSETGIL